MRICNVETFLIAPRWLFCKVSTDEGVSGWGEPVVEGRAETVRAAVHELAGLLIGADPTSHRMDTRKATEKTELGPLGDGRVLSDQRFPAATSSTATPMQTQSTAPAIVVRPDCRVCASSVCCRMPCPGR